MKTVSLDISIAAYSDATRLIAEICQRYHSATVIMTPHAPHARQQGFIRLSVQATAHPAQAEDLIIAEVTHHLKRPPYLPSEEEDPFGDTEPTRVGVPGLPGLIADSTPTAPGPTDDLEDSDV